MALSVRLSGSKRSWMTRMPTKKPPAEIAPPRADKPADCAGCPLASVAVGFVPAAIPDGDVVLRIQGEAPGSTEVSEGKPFVGRAGHWIRRNILAAARVDPDLAAWDNTLRCLPPKSGAEPYPKGKVRTAAEAHCRRYDRWLDPKLLTAPLLLLGGKALKVVLGHNSISDWHGHQEQHPTLGRVGATFHPAAVMRNPNLLPVVVAEIRHLVVPHRNPTQPLVNRFMPYSTPATGDMVVDLEWDGTGKVTAVGVAFSNNEAFSTFDVAGGLRLVENCLQRGLRLVGHNIIGADLKYINLPAGAPIFDTMIAAHLVHAHLAGAASLDEKDTGVGLLGLGDQVRMYFGVSNWKPDTSDLLRYNGLDCVYNYRLAQSLEADLRSTQQEHLLPIQQDLAFLTRQIEQTDIRVDREAARRIEQEQATLREGAAQVLPFNPRSPKQVQAWAEVNRVTLKDTRLPSIEKAARARPDLAAVWEPMLRLKQDWKPISTWFDEEAMERGTIRPRFHVTGTAVDRFSSSAPNMQNLPPVLRRLLLPPEGMRWAAFDYSQIENRLVAYQAHCKTAIEDYASGADVHRRTAARLFRKPESAITSDERRIAKTVVHAAGYGETVFHLAERLFASRSRDAVKRAQELQDSYFGVYPEIRQWQLSIERRMNQGQITVRNPFGRLRYIYAQNGHERMKRACHFLGCSTAAGILNRAALRIWHELSLLPSLIVHDELVFAVDPGEAGDRVIEQVTEMMQQPVEVLGGFVIPVEAKTGSNYGKASEANPDGLRAVEVAVPA